VAEIIWSAREGDGDTIEAIVARAGGDARAIDDGRVFIGRRRAKAHDRVSVGDEIRIVEKREDANAEVAILFRERGILAVDKPAGIPTIPDEHDASGSLVHRVARIAGLSPDALHPTSRLDRHVSGVVVFATNDAARELLQNARISAHYFRQYVAITTNAPKPAEGEWNARIGRARDPKKRMVNGRDATDASTKYRVAGVAGTYAVVIAEPITGRTHQIRVHASHAGAPIVGDRDYGGPRSIVLASGKVISLERIALHCARVRITTNDIDIRAPIPAELRALWRALGGLDTALEN
jgi:23S rRNA pseudouridine1911/1915/1917 synthase